MLKIGKQLTADQRLKKAVVDIIGHPNYIALAGVMLIGERGIAKGVPVKDLTACTNGRDETYGEEFVDNLNDAQLRLVVLHENYHKLYQHLKTYEHLFKIDQKIADRATDEFINNRIMEENSNGWVDMPRNPDGSIFGWCDPKFKGKNVVAIFNELMQEKQQQGGGQGEGQQQGQPGQGQSGQGQSGQGQSGQGQGQSGQGGGDSFDKHDWAGAKSMSQQDKSTLQRDIDEAIRQGALLAGKSGKGNANKNFDELLETQVNWRELLRDFVTQVMSGRDYSTWAKPNRRFIGSGFYLPSTLSESIGEMLIAPDTSGSIGDPEMQVVMSELKAICETVRPEKVHIWYWDTGVKKPEVHDQNDLDKIVENTRPRGGGGTDVTCVSNKMARENFTPECAVVITDGYLGGDWGTWNVPVLWVIVDNKHATPPNGTCVHVKTEDLL